MEKMAVRAALSPRPARVISLSVYVCHREFNRLFDHVPLWSHRLRLGSSNIGDLHGKRQRR